MFWASSHCNYCNFLLLYYCCCQHINYQYKLFSKISMLIPSANPICVQNQKLISRIKTPSAQAFWTAHSMFIIHFVWKKKKCIKQVDDSYMQIADPLIHRGYSMSLTLDCCELDECLMITGQCSTIDYWIRIVTLQSR